MAEHIWSHVDADGEDGGRRIGCRECGVLLSDVYRKRHGMACDGPPDAAGGEDPDSAAAPVQKTLADSVSVR